MGETAPNPQQLLASVANRLRLIQADFADEPESTRKDYIADEIKRAMASLVPAERAAFLDALSKEFPTWDNRVEISPSAPAPATSATDLKELKDPGFLIQRLLDIAPQLSVLQRDAIIAKLRDAGLTTAGTAQWPADALSQTRPKLQMAETDNPDATNILELLAILVEFANSLDQLIWTTWKTISPKSQVRRPMNLVKSIGRFASAQKDTPRGQVTQDLERTRQAVAAIISAISQASRVFAHNYAGKLAPAEIENLATLEGGGFFSGKETKFWKKYQELAPGKDAAAFEAAIESDIKQVLADYAESLMKGLAR